jgi:hypothetical protein
LIIIKGRCTILEARRKDILLSRIRLWLTIVVISFIRSPIIKEKGMTIYSIYKKDHYVIPKQVVTVVNLRYLGIEKDYPVEQLSALPCKKKRNQQELSAEEKEKSKFILKRGL